ncbi:hypothetical protein [Veillonella seminalis]|nr:hypothetical protein [Veillonella seminalis]
MGRKEGRAMYLVASEKGDYCFCETMDEAQEIFEQLELIYRNEDVNYGIFEQVVFPTP